MQLKLAELVAAFSRALDITEGQPEGHGMRCCWIGMRVGAALGLDARARWTLYYTLLLKDIGCSSNAARICELYLADDLAFKRDFKQVGPGLPRMLAFIVGNTGRHARWGQRVAAIAHILRNGDAIAQEMIGTRCDRGAQIVRRLRLPEPVAQGVRCLDEHFDGGGRPQGLVGDAIPLASRIALLAQVADVFHTAGGPPAALAEVRRCAGRWLDPRLARVLEEVARQPGFWEALSDPALPEVLLRLEPAQHAVEVDEDYLDEIAAAFGEVVDAKSPYTAGHSERVASYADEVASALGLAPARRRWLRRGALLHDVGKLGVSSAILDKPGRLDPDEWRAVQAHAAYTEDILGRIDAFAELARLAGAHHEKLDGSGYPRGLRDEDIALETRIITVADIFDAISAARPYHRAHSIEETLAIMRPQVGRALDPHCFGALESAVRQEAAPPPLALSA